MFLFLGVLTFFVILAFLILAHEIGHFTFAKVFGVRVEEFGLGFPPRITGRRRNGTLYSINAIPLGGFVRMLGENGHEDEPDGFGAKPPWQRLIILLAGPSMNILVALLIFFVTFVVGVSDGLPIVTSVAPHSPAQAAGLHKGDEIVAVNGRKVSYRSDLEYDISQRLGHPVTLSVYRDRHIFVARVTPRERPPRGQGAVGIGLADDTIVNYSADRAATLAVQQVGTMVTMLPALVASVPTHGTGDMAGPIGIAHYTTQTVSTAPQVGPSPIFALVAFLSANLGVLNLLPIPALDGGRIVFVLISWIRRRNLDPEVEGLIHMVGMGMLLVLIAVISYQDLARWLGGSF